MGKKKIKKEITIIGYVSEIGDEWEDFKGVMISTDDDEYIVKQDKMGNHLEHLIDEDVEVTGIVTRDEDGTQYIAVSEYEVLDLDYGLDEEDEEYNFE